MDHLERRLDLKAVVAISISSMLGSGIFVLPGIAIAETGPGVWLAYLFSALCVMPAAMSKCELATAMPSSGGTYVYLERTFGSLAGTLAGLSLWLSLLLKSAFALIGISAYLSIVSGFTIMGKTINIPLEGAALGLLVVIVLLNLVGVGKVGASIVAIVVISLGGLTAIAVFGSFTLELNRLNPMLTDGLPGVMAAAGLVFVSYAGVTKVAAIAEEIKQPERNLPRGILISLGLVTAVYVGLTFILVGNIDHRNLVGDLRPMHTLGVVLGGPVVGYIVAVLAILTMASMANSGILAASRFPFAMSRDHLIPEVFAKISRSWLTPWVSICSSGLIVMAAILLLDVAGIAKLASAVILAVYVLENVAVVVLRETRVQWYNPRFRSPMYPFLQIFGIVSGMALLIGMGQVALQAALAVIGPGILLYYLYSRRRSSRKGVFGVRLRRRQLLQTPGEAGIPMDGQAPDAVHTVQIRDAMVVIPLFGGERSPEVLVEIGAALASGGRMEVVHLTEIPEQMDLYGLGEDLHTPVIRSLERRIRVMAERTGADITFDKIPSHDVYQTVHEIGARGHCRWMVKEWGGKTTGAFTLHKQMGWLEDHLACHVMTFRDAGVRYVSRILLLTERGGSLDDVVLETTRHLATIFRAEIFVGVCLYQNGDDEQRRRNMAAAEKTAGDCGQNVRVVPIESNEGLRDAILEKAAEFDLMIMTTQKARTVGQRFFGTQQDAIIAAATCSVVCIQEYCDDEQDQRDRRLTESSSSEPAQGE